ncbi:MAG: TetR family transcriptional regulator [Spirochaetia bacterium]|nr:TetR family transcriptional regulator [Spirochaetia bacterium]
MRKTRLDAEKTKQDIIDAGIKIFSSKLYAVVNMSDIAKEAGVTRGAIYWHFKNKRDLFMEIHNLVVKEIETIVSSSITQGITLKERTFSILNNILLKYSRDKKLRQMNRVLYLNQAVFDMKEFKENHLNYHKSKEQFFTDLIRKATGKDIDVKSDRNVMIEFLSVAAYMQGITEMIIFQEEAGLPKLDEKGITQLINIFLDGLFSYDRPVETA